MIAGAFFSQMDNALLTRAISFFKRSLDIDKSDIEINIKLVDNIGRGKIGGTCQPQYDKDLNLTSVNIEVKQSVSVIGMIEVLAHEMVHAKQFIEGEISREIRMIKLLGIIPVPRVKRMWKGQDVSDLPYYQQPSEIEAHMLQKYMTLQFLKTYESQLEPSNMSTLLAKCAISKLDQAVQALADSILKK